MKLNKKIVAGVLAIYFVILTLVAPGLSMNAHAASGRMVIGLSNSSAAVGDQITVYITAKDANNASVSANVQVTYNTSVFEYVSCNAQGATSGNGSITAAGSSMSITFKAIGEGECRVVASGTTDAGELTAGGVRVPVTAAAGANEPDETNNQPEEPEDTKTPEENSDTTEPSFDIDGVTYKVSSDFSNELVNQGFTVTEVQVQNVKVKGLQYKDTGWCVLFLINKDKDTDNGYYLYDPESGELCPYLGYGIGNAESDETDQSTISQDNYNKLQERYDDLRSSNRKMLIGMIVGAVVIVLLFINILIFRSINRREEEEEDEDYDDEYDESEVIEKQGAYLEATASNSASREEKQRESREPDLAADVASIMKQGEKKKTTVTNDDSLEIIDFEDL